MFSRFSRRIVLEKKILRANFKTQTLCFSSREDEDINFSSHPAKHNKTKNKQNANIKRTLATTNKVMFGPLLETAKEKRQRLKYEALGKEMPKKAKRRQFERRMKDEDYESLLDKPENSHLLGIFNDNKNSKKIIKSQESNAMENIDSNEKLLKKMPVKVVMNNNVYVTKSQPKLRKLTFGPCTNDNDYNFKKVDTQKKENFLYESQRISKIILLNKSSELSTDSNKFVQSDSIAEDHLQIDNASLNDTTEEMKNNQGYSKHNVSQIRIDKRYSKYNNVSQIRIDNSKWTAAPNTIDLNALNKATLVPQNYITKPIEDESVKTIRIFEGGYQKLPSVTKILEETMPISSRIALDKWKAKMIAELGEKGFAEYQQNNFDIGKAFHSCIEARLQNKEPLTEDLARCSGHWESIERVMPGVKNVVALESRILHPKLYYQGVVDCVANYRGKPVLIEWKTSKKPKTTVKSMYDNPLQVTAYIGALNYDPNYSLQQPIDSGLLVAAYECGSPADVHVLRPNDCQNLWKIWLDRLAKFWLKKEIVFPIT